MNILKSVKDPTCLAIHPYMEESEEKLEEMMPTEEIPSGKSVAAQMHDMEPLNDEQRMQMAELFDNVEVMHNHLV